MNRLSLAPRACAGLFGTKPAFVSTQLLLLSQQQSFFSSSSSSARSFSRVSEGAHARVLAPRPSSSNNAHNEFSAASLAAVALFWGISSVMCEENEEDEDEVVVGGELKKGLPNIYRKEVAKHNSPETGVWVTYKRGVYDVSKFVGMHPGGDKIMLAAGGAVDPYWEVYNVHNKSAVFEILEQYRIGNVPEEDMEVPQVDVNDPFCNDPKRHPAFIYASAKPCNAEPPISLLVDNFLTPNSLWFVRNHQPVPDIKAQDYKLQIEIEGKAPISLTLEDLKKFPEHSVYATLQCAGNRRAEMQSVRMARGLSWRQGAISNAKWTGARLRDVLKHCGIDEKLEDVLLHVRFEGLDRDGTLGYGSSIPMSKAMDRHGDVILAWKMNDEDIPRDHGYPVRAVAPGIVAARSVKWVGKVQACREEATDIWQKTDYKVFGPNIDWDTVDWTSAPAMQEQPVMSAIAEPRDGAVIDCSDNGELVMKGFAYSGGGRSVVRVDYSVDGGLTWKQADLLPRPEPAGYNMDWAWRLWEARVPKKDLPADRPVELICKASDSSYNVQPEHFAPIWNIRGVSCNAWHRVRVKAECRI